MKSLRHAGLACLLAVSTAVSAQPSAPPASAPSAPYFNPFDLTHWLAVLSVAANQAVTKPAAPTAPSASTPGLPLDLNALLAAAPTAAGKPPSGSAYVMQDTAYGRLPVFNQADPEVWRKFFAHPFQTPEQAALK